MVKFRHLWIEQYGGLNIYYVRCDRKDYEKLIKDEFGMDAPVKKSSVGADFEIYAKKGQEIGIIWFSKKAKLEQVVHEIFHTVHWFLSERGLWLTDSSEESYAYLMEYLFKKLKHI